MMNLRVLERDCLTIIIMPLFMFKSLTLALLYIPVYLMICCLMGTYIHWVLMFVWVRLFRKRVVSASIGTYICGVLVNDGYLCSRVYGSFFPLGVYVYIDSCVKCLVLHFALCS